MGIALQKASLWKRVAAWGLDLILLCTLAVGAQFALAKALRYDDYNNTLQAAFDRYENQYGVALEISPEAYAALNETEKAAYDAAYEDLNKDEEAMEAYNRLITISLSTTTVGILLAALALEFVIPLLFKNGQTLGKKAMGLGLVRSDGVKINTAQLLVRALLGKFTVEIMIPVYLVLMMFWGILGFTGTVALGIFALVQFGLLLFTRNNTPIHDLLSGTAVVELLGQRIFNSTEEMIAYAKQLHAQQAAEKEY